ncbi:hypothetical protein F383_34858 [Gossypium arboreum]|uniref:Uncharacterized protein n=1 Tax=Gossypium arboreum TaxID=29729 RepID=A0A0B0N0J9_GOSAR|nr:hypothetical protein F383_34858 [Gossypium arboreum]
MWRTQPSTRACALAVFLKMNDDVINIMSGFLDTDMSRLLPKSMSGNASYFVPISGKRKGVTDAMKVPRWACSAKLAQG